MNPYEELGVSKDADAGVLKRARRRLAKKLHPDRNPDGAARMAVINLAFDILMDPVRRANFDQTGHERVQPLEEKARSIVLQLFLAISQERTKTNVPKRVIQQLEQSLEQQQRNQKEGERILGHFEDRLADVATTDTVDLWRGVIEQQIAGTKLKLGQNEQEIAATTRAIEIAKCYRSTVKEAENTFEMRAVRGGVIFSQTSGG